MTQTDEASSHQSPTNAGDAPIETKTEPRDRAPSSLQAKLAVISGQQDPEIRLALAVEEMEKSLAQAGSPQFKIFWELRKICLEAFKTSLSPGLRATLWPRYRTLLEEARRLKDILDEHSKFAVEQIELAVKSLESELDALPQLLEKSPQTQFPVQSTMVERSFQTYDALQRELSLLNASASRINALRKELMKTEMRIGQKNKFFQRLSSAGDRVFPRRKELIKSVSDQFTRDVDAFVALAFPNEAPPESISDVREEIKALQVIAKSLTLNTQSFTHTRGKLSEAWERVKNAEKERKRERVQRQAAFQENALQIQGQLQAFKEQFGKGELTSEAALKRLDEIAKNMRHVELSHPEIRALKGEIQNARQPIYDKINAQEAERHQQEREREKVRRKAIEDLKTRIDTLVKDSQEMEGDEITEKRQALLEEIAGSSLMRTERMDFERRLKPLRDLIAEKRERALLSLSADDQGKLENLRQVLDERMERRLEIKTQLDAIRKAASVSGLDFEQAMTLNAQQAEERERLARADQAIEEIETQISDLEE